MKVFGTNARAPSGPTDCSSSGYLCDQVRRPLAVSCRRGIVGGMSFEPEYPDTLELIGPQGGRVKIADFLVGEPIEVDGLKYKTITITTPLRNIKPGDRLQVVDAADADKVICIFVAESVTMILRGEVLCHIDGKVYLRNGS